jgi:hypothetical protein
LLTAAHEITHGSNLTKNECRPLEPLSTAPHLTPYEVEAYTQSIEILQWTFDTEHVAQAVDRATNMISAWPIRVTNEYIDLLTQRKSEALVILAYFAVLLHYRRRVWIIADGGEHLLQCIRQELGSEYDHLVAWPIAVIESQV